MLHHQQIFGSLRENTGRMTVIVYDVCFGYYAYNLEQNYGLKILNPYYTFSDTYNSISSLFD